MESRKKFIMIFIRVAAYIGLIYGGVRFFEWRSVYAPSREIERTPKDVGLEYEDVNFVASDDIRLHGWWIPSQNARGTVIIFHGNASNIGNRVWMAMDLHSLGVNVFLFDYRGYGRSSGLPTEKGTYRDARAAFEYVRSRYDNMDNPPVILYGRSLGGAIALQCALEKGAKGLILESTFTSIPDIGREMYPWLPIKLLSTYRYDNLHKIPRINIPLLAASSPDDTLVPYQQTRALFEAASDPKFWLELSGDHNESGWNTAPSYWNALKDFIKFTLGERAVVNPKP